MKTTYKPRPKKIHWSESNKEGCRKMKWKNAGDADGAQCPDTQRPGTATGRQPGGVRPGTKWTNDTTDLITRSSPVLLQSMRENAGKSSGGVPASPSLLLPPIRGSPMSNSQVIAASTFTPKARPVGYEDSNARLLACVTKENALFRLYLTNQEKPSNLFKARLVHGSVAVEKSESAGEGARARNKPGISQVLATRSQLVRRAEEQGSDAINTCSSDCEATMCAIKHASKKKELSGDATEAGPHRDQAEDEWRETDLLGCLQAGEYYTDQKISEWILNVNASLFSPSNGSVGSNGPSEEQDTSIKIVYDG